MPDQEPSGEGPASISIYESQGTQVGTGNVQYNNYGHRPPRDLSALSLHAAVAYIRQLTHDEAVDLFAHTRPDDLADKLKVLLRTDESMVLNILADLNPRQATELISPLTDDFPWLAGLPKAATAIAHLALELRWDPAPGTGGIERAPESPQGTSGYFQQYGQGRVYWRDDKEDAAYGVTAAMVDCYLAVGGTGGELGFPSSDAVDWKPAIGTEGLEQTFEGGYIDSSPRGIYPIFDLIGNSDMDWDRLGFPVAAAEARGDAIRQPFEAGAVYASDAGAFEVRPDFESLATDCFPVWAEEDIPSTDAGRMQRFKSIKGRDLTMYSSSDTSARRVTGERLALYDQLGGPASSLGFPTSSTTSVEGGWTQRFQHGTIYHQKGRDPLAVPAETVELSGDRLGWPVSGEESIGGIDDNRIQFFENGIVTLRSGKLEMWLRPVPADRPPAATTTTTDAALPATTTKVGRRFE